MTLWRLVGDSSWINLVALADLKGDPGEVPEAPLTGGPFG